MPIKIPMTGEITKEEFKIIMRANAIEMRENLKQNNIDKRAYVVGWGGRT